LAKNVGGWFTNILLAPPAKKVWPRLWLEDYNYYTICFILLCKHEISLMLIPKWFLLSLFATNSIQYLIFVFIFMDYTFSYLFIFKKKT